jgi:hypothetical protein
MEVEGGGCLVPEFLQPEIQGSGAARSGTAANQPSPCTPIESAILCQGYARSGGVVLHMQGCPVLLREGEHGHATHCLSAACAPAYRKWSRGGSQ